MKNFNAVTHVTHAVGYMQDTWTERKCPTGHKNSWWQNNDFSDGITENK